MIIIPGRTFCPTAFMKCALKYLFALTLAFNSAATFAQSSEDTFRGTWQVQVPEKGALVIILKNQGLASYFWGDNADRTVYQGSWELSGNTATATWKDGSSHTIERTDSGFNASFRNPSGEAAYQSPAEQLPREMLGQWAKPPTREDEMRSDRDEAEGFFGIWQLADSEDFIFVEPDRATASNIGEGAGQRGQWAKQGSELHIIWDRGHYGILRETERGFDYKQVEPGQVIEDDESETVAAARTIESKVPDDWFADYKAEREADSEGIAFSSRKVARAFYRGDWLVHRGENKYERVELARFGGIKTSKDRSLGGQWTMNGQDVFMRWDDGMRKILSPVGRGFVLYEYKPGRPVDGVPTRIFAAAPADTAKLDEHMEGRQEVAEQMREMAEAAGVDPATQENTGWGRTFARWAWPFGEEDDGMSTEEMLEEEYAPEAASDPWWWPFWSEKPEEAVEEADDDEAKASEANGEEPETQPESTGEAETAAPENQEQATAPIEIGEVQSDKEQEAGVANAKDEKSDASNKKKERSRTKDWLWPF